MGVLHWTDYPALRKERPGLAPLILAEVDAHVTNPSYWESSDHGNWCHEGTHGCNADLRNSHDNRPCLYLGGDKCLLLTHPKTTISQLARLVPEDFRGFEYSTYCVQQAGQWDAEPLYLWDEWSAYCNGAQVLDGSQVLYSHKPQGCRAVRVREGMRGYTLSEYLPIGLVLALVDLGPQERAALDFMLAESSMWCDRTHKYVQALASGTAGQVYRDRVPMLSEVFR